MKMTELFLAQLDAEGPRTRRTLEHVPQGRDDWKPHEKSMPLGRLAMLVARMPSWIPLILNQDHLDLGAGNVSQQALRTPAELVKAHDEGLAAAREALSKASDDHLRTTWKLMMNGKVVSEERREIVVRDTMMHLSHHRGQLTVYLRLNDAMVPAIYGPSADEMRFA